VKRSPQEDTVTRVGLILSLPLSLILWSAIQPLSSQTKEDPASFHSPQFTPDNRLVFPSNYREWIYLSSGVDMNYNPAFQKMDHSMFDNVFVNPEAYKSFLQTGTWPDKTMLVLELRMASDHGSINKNGQFQAGEVMGIEVHVKDETHIPGKWAFYGFEDEKPGTAFAKDMPCYSCHEQHGAVDTTFTQFYPTLIEIAKKKGTLSATYLKEEAAATKETNSKKP
jgi:Cytochrome P460